MSCDARHRLCDFGFIQHLTTAVAEPLPVSEKMNPPGRSVPERWAFWTGTRRTGTIWFRKTVFRASPPGYHRPFHDFPPGCMQFAHDLITIDAESALSYPRSTGVAGFYSRRNAINTQQLEPAGSSSQIKMRASVSRATSRALRGEPTVQCMQSSAYQASRGLGPTSRSSSLEPETVGRCLRGRTLTGSQLRLGRGSKGKGSVRCMEC